MWSTEFRVTPQRILFLGEFSERFCFWGLQSILVLYLINVVHLSTVESYKMQGLFTATSFLFCILGGFFSDRFFGFQWSLIVGSMLVVIGSVFLTCPALNFLFGLFVISLGNGFFEPSCASIFRSFRNEITNNHEKNFTLLYMSMNLGAVLGPLFYGVMSTTYGWSVAIFLNAMVMALWCLVFLSLKDKLFNVDLRKPEKIRDNTKLSVKPILGILGLMIFSILFFATAFQVYNSLIIFSKIAINTSVLGYQISPSAVAGFEPFFVILIALVMSRFSIKGSTNFMNTFVRLSIAFFLAGLSFIVFELAASRVGAYGAKVSILWIVLGSFFLGAGEVCFMPSVISTVTKYAPTKIRGTLTGFFYCSFALSVYFSSFIAKMTNSAAINANFDVLTFYEVYAHTALILLSISVLLFLLLFIDSSSRQSSFLGQ